MRTWIISLMGGLALPAALALGADFGAIKANPDGSLKIGELSAEAICFDSQWNASSQSARTVKPDDGFPKTIDGAWRLNGFFAVNGGNFSLAESLAKGEDGAANLDISLKSESPVDVKDLAILFSLPVDKFAGRVIDIDGRKITLPAEYSDKNFIMLSKSPFGALSLQCQDFKLEVSGGAGILVQDDRKFNLSNYSIRVRFSPGNGAISAASIKLKLKAQPYDTTPITLRPVTNMGFSDEVAGDGKGGWTDQGPDNDLRMLKTGRQLLGGVAFDVIDPKSNGGKSCLVFGGNQVPSLPNAATLAVPGISMKYLCVLHALGWSPSGKEKTGSLGVTYADGSKKTFPIVNGVDAGNWWSPASVDNAQVVWTGENRNSFVGLYMSSFPLEAKPVSKVDFVNDGNSMWMIAGVSASNDEIPRLQSVPCYIVESADWKPFDYPREVEKGSVLDLSNLLDAPAGKHGRVIVKDGKFVFENEPSKPVRFYGTNFCMSMNYLTKTQAEKAASIIATYGYNSVRFHHFDNQLALKKGKSSTELNPSEIDKLDYLFKCLKDKGVYSTIDVYISRIPQPGELNGFGDRKLSMLDIGSIKALMIISDQAMENFEAYSRNLFNHVNPYTGLAWKDDPALAFVSLINEDTIFSCWNRDPAIKALYEAKFGEWLKAKGLASATAQERTRLMERFLVEVYNKAYSRMASFTKSLGVKAPLTDQNMWSSISMAPMRDNYDYVDNHTYWDHPRFPVTPWKMPMAFSSKSSVKAMAGSPAELFPSRIFGKPYTVTEFNFCFPNHYRAEGGALMGAYAAFQDWDGIYRFTYSHGSRSVDNDGPGGLFDSATEPMQFLSEKLAVLLFLRGDVRPSELKIPILVKSNTIDTANAGTCYSNAQVKAGLLGQLGSVIDYDGKAKLPAGTKAVLRAESTDDAEQTVAKLKAAYDFGKGAYEPGRKFARSSTGELEVDGEAGYFKVSTPRSEAIVTLNVGKLSSGVMGTVNKTGFASISASSLDGKPLASSGRMLVLHLTDAMNAMTKFSDKTMTMMESSGNLPHLARRGVADLTFNLAAGKTPKVYALDLAGRRVGEIEAKFSKDGTLSFTFDIFALKTPCFAYEIVR